MMKSSNYWLEQLLDVQHLKQNLEADALLIKPLSKKSIKSLTKKETVTDLRAMLKRGDSSHA